MIECYKIIIGNFIQFYCLHIINLEPLCTVKRVFHTLTETAAPQIIKKYKPNILATNQKVIGHL